MKRKHIYNIVRFAISAGLIGYFIMYLSHRYNGPEAAFRQFVSTFSQVNITWLIPAVLLHLVGFSLTSLRWKVLLTAQNSKSRFRQLFIYYFMATFFNTFLPSTIGGDAVRVMESRRHTANTATSLVVIIIERLSGLLALVLIAFAAVCAKGPFVSTQLQITFFLLLAILAGFLVLAFLARPRTAGKFQNLIKKIFPQKWHEKAGQAISAMALFYRKPLELTKCLLISIVFQMNMVLYYYLIARTLGLHPAPLDFMQNVPLMIIMLMLIPAINGLGVRTAGFKTLLDFSAAFALAAEIVDLGIRIGYGLLGGVLFLFYKPDSKK